MRALRVGIVCAASAIAVPARAFVPLPVGGHAGEVDFGARLTLERGGIEPSEDAGSRQRARSNLYTVGGGYTFGDAGPLLDLRAGIDATYFHSPAEQNDLARRAIPASRCLGVVVGDGVCQFAAADDGVLVVPRLSFNFVHENDVAFGGWIQGTIPIDVDLRRFTAPRADYVGGGLSLGVHPKPWLAIEAYVFVGSGAIGSSEKQSSVIAQSTFVGFEAQRWLLPWKAGIKLGPYWEGDLSRRYDDAYNAAYPTAYPDQRTRIQALKFGVAFLPYVQITKHVALELGYIQKFFGYDASHTQTYYVGVRGAL